MRLQQSQSGMSLIEVMVAISILSVISVAVLTMSKNMDKSVKNAEKRGDIESLMLLINQHMANKENCTATVLGAAPAVNSTTMLTSLKLFRDTGRLTSDPRLSVKSVSATDTRNQVIINGMYLTNRADTGIGGNYDLVITFVKNPKAATGAAISAGGTVTNYVTRKIPLSLDNCQRTLRWAVAPNTPTCAVGTAVGAPISVNSANGSSPDTTFNVIACRDCATRVTVRGCN